MTQRFTRLWALCFLSFGLVPTSQADCLTNELEQLAFETFESGIPTSWIAPPTSDGDSWQADPLTFGYYENPGSNNWAYVNDEARNKVGTASLTTPVWSVEDYQAYLQLEFDVNFQEYAGQGFFKLTVWDGDKWVKVYETREDLVARVSIDITPYANEALQVVFTYSDEGTWGWGMGVDNVKLSGKAGACGNGICDLGETPSTCGDCEALPQPATSWLPPEHDIEGETVLYQEFRKEPCDDCSEEVELGFELDFLGEKYETVFLNTNGNLTFETPYTSFAPEPFCLKGPKMIAPFFADVDLTEGGDISYFADPEGHYFIAKWTEVSFFGASDTNTRTNTFQVILTDGTIRSVKDFLIPIGANIVFTYGNMEWTTGSSSGGVAGFGGAPATIGINLGDGQTCQDYGVFDREGFAYYGNFQDDYCIGNGVSHLDYRTLAFNSSNGEFTEPSGNIVLKGAQESEGVTLIWCTDDLDETQFFVLERISGAEQTIFEEITMVNVDDPLSRQKGEYVYVDQDAVPDTNFYRITEVNTDGTLDFSSVVAVFNKVENGAVGAENTLLMLSEVGPNPFRNQLNVNYELETTATVQYQLVDMTGKPVLKGSWQALQGPNHAQLSLPDLPRAMYIFTLSTGNEITHMNLIHD